MNEKHVTIKDIAKVTGFSTQTVSRVVNNDSKVKESTKKIILEAISKFDYKPNLYAKALVGKRNKNILILLKRKSGSKATIWTNTLINEIIICNRNNNFSIFVEQYYDDEELKKSLISTTSSFIDGVIIFYEEEKDKRIELLKQNNIPFVIFGKSYKDENIYVSNEDFNSTYKATEYLLSQNIQDIVFVSANITPMNEERVKGITQAYADNNINLNKLNIIRHINTSQDLYNLSENFKNNLPQCFFVAGDEKAIVLIKALNDLNIKVPEDVSVMGFDNLAISQYITPALTTVSLDYKNLANKLLNKIINITEGKKEVSQEIKSELIIRDSIKTRGK